MKRTLVVLVDDLDETELTESTGAEVLRIVIGDTAYDLDLTTEHLEMFKSKTGEFLAVARRSPLSASKRKPRA